MEVSFRLFASVLLLAVGCSALVDFKPGFQYQYKYSASTTLKHAGVVLTSAKININVLGGDKWNRQCQFEVKNFLHALQGQKTNHKDQEDLSKWFSFNISNNGEILGVQYPEDEKLSAVIQKKALLGTFSARLHASYQDLNHGGNRQWRYVVNETGHEGVHEAEYEGKNEGDTLIFKRKKSSHIVPNAETAHQKEIWYHKEKQVPSKILVDEKFTAPRKVMRGYQLPPAIPVGFGQSHMYETDDSFELPEMHTFSNGQMELTDVVPMPTVPKLPGNLVKGDLYIEEYPKINFPLDATVQKQITGNLTCMREVRPHYSRKRMMCFERLISIMGHLKEEDVAKVADEYIQFPPKGQNGTEDMESIIDALGASGVEEAQIILTERIMLRNPPDPELLKRMFSHFVNLEHPPAAIFLDALEEFVFRTDPPADHKSDDEDIMAMATLLLGSLAGKLKSSHPERSESIVINLEVQLQPHDPQKHRARRSAEMAEDLKSGHKDEDGYSNHYAYSNKSYINHHEQRKSTLLLSLGNAGLDRSYDHILSYINTTDSPQLLKRSGASALANYNHEHAASMLLRMAIDESHEDHVRYDALLEYRKHPKAVPINDLHYHLIRGLTNVTGLETNDRSRLKRSFLDDLLNFKFDFKLKLPGIEWKKQIGSDKVGAAFGLTIRNVMDLSISLLKGHFKLDVLDEVYAVANFGIIGFNLDIVRMRVCFRGGIKYDVNILKEFNFEDMIKTITTLDKVVDRIVGTIKNTVNNFKKLFDSASEFSFPRLIQKFAEIFEELPKKVDNLISIGQKTTVALGEMINPPAYLTAIVNVVRRVTGLMNDIKRDVTKFVDSIYDAITITLPWAIEQIKEAVNMVVNTLKNFFSSPLSALGDVQKAVLKIQNGIFKVLDAKNRIQKACLFKKGQRPYWFDIKTVLTEIWDEILSAKDVLTNSIKNFKINLDTADAAIRFKKFTGVSPKVFKKQMMSEVIDAFDIFAAPLRVLQELAAPFVDTYESVIGKLRAVKRAYTFVKNAYGKARTLLNKVFGPKMHKDFPRKILQSDRCSGHGPYPSTGNGKYKHQGVDLELNKTAIKVPFTGNLRINDSSKGIVSILLDNPDGIELIIEPVTVPSAKHGMKVFKGESLGTAKSSGCTAKMLHVAMRKAGTTEYIDPMKYLEKRKPGFPKWNTECDDYRVVLLGITFVKGSLTKGPANKNTTLDRKKPPDTSDVTPIGGSSRRKREATAAQLALQANPADLTAQLGIPPLSEIGPALTGFKDVKAAAVLKLLGKVGLTEYQKKLQGALDMLEDLLGGGRCVATEMMDDGTLKLGLKARGLPLNGSRAIKIARFKAPDSGCSHLHASLPGGTQCSFKDGCYGIRCCVPLVFTVIRRVFEASVQLDPCNKLLTMKVGEFSRTFNTSKVRLAETYSGPVVTNRNIHDPVAVTFGYTVVKRSNIVTFNLRVSVCGAMKCQPWTQVFKDVTYDLNAAKQKCTDMKAATSSSKVLDMAALKQKTMTEIKELVAIKNPDSFNIQALMTDLRTAYLELVMSAMNNVLGKLFNGQFNSFDVCMRGQKLYGPYDKTFLKLTFNFMAGPIPLSFEFASGGSWKVTCGVNLCFMTMKAVGTAVPQLGAYVSGELSINLFLFKAGIKLIGYLLTTKFPTKAEIGFAKFPLDVNVRMDLELIPLRLELHVIVKLTINLLFTTIEEVIVKELIWSYQTPTITANIFNTFSKEKDESPPQFKKFSSPQPASGVARRAPESSECTVYQVKGLDETEPAFQLAIAADDDKSEVTVTYSVSTFPGGSDLVENEDLGGPSSVVDQVLPERIPLYFTVTAANSEGASASVTCGLDYYDLSPPAGRVNPDFFTTSHPNVLKATGMAVDETPLVEKKEGVGLGRGIFGDQTFPWADVLDDTERSSFVAKTSDPNSELVALSKFASERIGKLTSTPIQVTEGYSSPGKCAADCLALPPLRCYSFNYDYGESGRCELLAESEGYGVELREAGHFHYFERLGIGKPVTFDHRDLELQHNQLYYFNYLLTNDLGYTSILTSRPVKVDFTPVEPGYLENVEYDEIAKEPCHEILPDEWENRCVDEASIPNHRAIIDGAGSTTVFNGHTPFVDLLYTRANKYVSANWDGFKDNETGIFGYTWSVGTTRCEDNIHPHRDPHAHLFDESEWTHTGIAHPLDLEDGKYYVNVRAINKVEYGGPLGTTVCHSNPYAIDNTEPFINEVHEMLYNDVTFVISASYNVSDPLSGIELMHIGLGKSKRDTYILEWFLHEDTSFVNFTHKIQDGLPTWLRIRAVNHVDLRTSGSGPYPIMIDMTHPLAGEIYDGKSHGRQVNFTAMQGEICSNWKDFRDPDTGIADYLWGVGTSPGDDDVVEFKRLGHTVFLECDRSVNLTHNETYYSTLFAFNRGHKRLNVSASTTGIMVDLTPPEAGFLQDSDVVGEDLTFSSDPATVAGHWGNFTDPESGIMDFSIAVERKQKDQAENEVIHESESVGMTTSFRWHHFHLHQGDQVFVNLNVTNRALGITSLMSNGFVLDLTPPELIYLRDGMDPDRDLQYSTSTTELMANWMFIDEETGVNHIDLQMYQTYGGTKTKLGDSVSLDGAAQNWTSTQAITLNIGALYTIRVHAINAAGLTAVHETDGVLIDPTPPRLLYVHAGVLSGDEELTNGYVVVTNAGILAASWMGVDGESGIIGYWIGLGTTSGGDDVVAFYNAGEGTDIILTELPLELFDDSSKLYYLSVKAQNGAGAFSTTITASPIKVVQADVSGLVFDGAGAIDLTAPTVDVNYQLESTTVSLRFEGYASAQHGISGYEWGIGTSPGTDDIQPFTGMGIVAFKDEPGSGIAQLPLPLSPDIRYYSSVRAITGAGNILESTSDGFGVDQSAPSVSIVSVGEDDDDDDDKKPLKHSTVYQAANVGSLSAEWNIVDNESAIADAWFAIGFSPASSDLYNITNTNKRTSLQAGLLTPSADGTPNVVTVSAINKVGLVSSDVSPPVVFDATPPERVTVACPQHISGEVPFTCSWDGINDQESGVQRYIFSLGVNETDDSVLTKTFYPPKTHFSVKGLDKSFLYHGAKLYARVTAVNGADLRSTSFSDAIDVDATPPVPGVVVEVNENVTANGLCSTKDECLASDVACQTSVEHVHVAWEPFTDPDSGLIRYEIAIGTASGRADLRDFTKVPLGMTSHIFYPIDLLSVAQVFATVRGYNGAGRFAIARSNGVYISRISAGLAPLEPQFVHDGKRPGVDMDFTDITDEVSARWSFGDPCPMVHYNWSIHRMDGFEIQPSVTLPGDQTLGENSNVKVRDGQSYFSVVSATNQLGDTFVQRSNGIRIKIEPLRPGIVRDGAIAVLDQNYQLSNTTLSATWDRFGNDIYAPEVTNGNERDDLTSNKHQTIDHYEVAVGSDRRYISTRSNVYPFTSVGKNRSVTLHDLDLISHGTYYVTVRAISVSYTRADVTSNGIKVGVMSKVISHGTLNLLRYISSTTSLTFSWEGFEFSLPLLYYYWGMGTVPFHTENATCPEMHQFDESGALKNDYVSLFDLYPFTNVRKTQFVDLNNLTLEHKGTYYVTVMATDESLQCDIISLPVTVDTTPPKKGQVDVGPFKNLPLQYTNRSDELFVSWEGFWDDESDIASYKISLLGPERCRNMYDNAPLVIDPVNVNDTYSNYTFKDLFLNEKVVYFVQLDAINGASGFSTVTSSPVLVDPRDPIPGAVMDGDSFMRDISHQSSLTHLHGTFTMYHGLEPYQCSYNHHDLDAPTEEWKPVTAQGVWGTSIEASRIKFVPEQLSFEEDEGLTVTMVRDVRAERMISGGYMTVLNHEGPGMFQIEMVAASNETDSVTSMMFWDGPMGVVGGFEAPKEPVEVDENSTTIAPTTTAAPTVNPFQIVNEDSDELSDAKAMLRRIPYTGLGMDIFAEQAGNFTEYYALLWSRFVDKPSGLQYERIELGFDASEAWHTYGLKYVVDRTDATQELWGLELHVDGVYVTTVTGIPAPNPSTMMILTVRNRKGAVAEFQDANNPPSVQAHFRNLKTPPSVDQLCRYGTPFQDGSTTILKLYAGVGSMKGADDVREFVEIEDVCLPCKDRCSTYNCDVSCAVDEINLHHVYINNLNLSTHMLVVEDDNSTTSVPALYYVTIKAVSGSERFVVVSSDGVYVDATPPVFNDLFHVDLAWSEDQPIESQGSNSTIAVRWEAFDIESKIVEYFWAIGTAPYSDNIQDFVSVGLASKANNSDLEGILQPHMTYYATVMAVNAAGLNSTETSKGVTLVEESPAKDPNATVGVEGCGEDGICPGAGSSVGVALPKFKPEDGITGIYVSIGSTEELEDIIPNTQVGYNESGTVAIDGGQILFNGRVMANISDLGDQSDQLSDPGAKKSNNFNMEPGRKMYVKVKACNKAHKCTVIDTKTVTVSREGDEVAKPNERGEVALSLSAPSSKRSAGQTGVSIQATGVGEGGGFLAGMLNTEDEDEEYSSGASKDFTPFIVSPHKTINSTERILNGRLLELQESFYITSLGEKPLSGPLDITVPITLPLDEETLPALLFWNTDHQQWMDASRTCPDTYISSFDADKNVLNVKVCSIHPKTKTSKKRRRRSTDSPYFQGEVQLGVFTIDKTIRNSAPVITTPGSTWMNEDAGTLNAHLKAEDPEGDELIFSLDTESVKVMTGHAVMSPEGLLQYTPCLHCHGQDEIDYIVREKLTFQPEALEVKATFTIDVRSTNDDPDLVFLEDGVNIVSVRGPLAYNPLKLPIMQGGERDVLFWMYDVDAADIADDLAFQETQPTHGSLMQIGQACKDVTFTSVSCDTGNIDDLVTLNGADDTCTVCRPLNLNNTGSKGIDDVSWGLAKWTYTAKNVSFMYSSLFGKDTFSLQGVDADGGVSKKLPVDMLVLQECKNGGTCVGPAEDPDCENPEAATDLDAYYCNCTEGYLGALCHLEFIPCPVPIAPEDGSYSPYVNGTAYNGDVVMFSCEVGFWLKGDSAHMCQWDGTWNGTAPTCEVVQCPTIPNPDNGAVVPPGPKFYDDLASIKCDEGYWLNGSSIPIYCDADGNWNGTLPNCPPVPCPPITLGNGTMIPSGLKYYPDVADFTCEEGFTLDGASRLTCQSDGTWSDDAPTCNPIPCLEPLTAPPNGEVSFSGLGAFYQENATFTCTLGYVPEGDHILTCLANGTWTGTAPTCRIALCPTLSAPRGGTLTVDTPSFYLAEAIFTCPDPSHVMVGHSTITCQGDETWSAPAPTCERCRDAISLPGKNFHMYDNHCYWFSRRRDVMKYHEAADFCAGGGHGGKLVNIKTPEENTFITNVVKGFRMRRNFWIGLDDNESESYFTWSDGMNLLPGSFTNWKFPPRRHKKRDCVTIHRQGLKWVLVNCDKARNAFICEMDDTKLN
ncbi:SELE [Branchiostoma lanceolatum]|uniref:SELE protein n=1 Tax=Branchiostoma lanceolatum TaxID=7740 RepID=A0A8J9Z7E2_BRALA|nr:SELE [Branchiostoma lanceolatum]